MAVNNTYQAEVGIKFNDTQLNKQLKSLSEKNITVNAKLTGGATQQAKDLQNSLKDVTSSAKEVSPNLEKASKSSKSMGDNFNHSSREGKNLADQFVDITKKVLAFGTATQVIMLFRRGISEAITSIREMDSALIELRKVSDLSGEGLKNYTKDAFDLAEQLHTTASNVTEAVTEFSKSSYNVEESKLLAEQAIIFQTIADGEIEASDAATTLIQVMKAYNMTVEDSSHIVNALNEVSNRYAVSSTDLSASIGKVASSANLAGVDFDHLLGLITASTEITQNASKSANGFKSILVNLMSDKYEKQFKEFGLSMRDTNGAMKDGYTIIAELSNKYKQLGEKLDETGEHSISLDDNMNALLTDIAGKHNINVLTAALSNFNQAINATNSASALNSAGSAQDEYQVALDGITKRLDALKGQFQELVYGEGGLANFIKFIIDTGTAILKFANSDISQLIIKFTALIGTLALLNKSFNLLVHTGIGTLIREISMLKGGTAIAVTSLNTFAVANTTLSASFKGLTASMLANPLFWPAVAVGAIGVISGLIDKFTVSADEAKESLNKFSQEYETASSKVKSLEDELKNVKDKIKEINSLEGAKTTREGELQTLELQADELERQLRIQQDITNEAKEQAEESAKKVLTNVSVKQTGVSDTGEAIYGAETQVQKLQSITDAIKLLKDEQNKLNEDYKNGSITTTEYSDKSEKLKEKISDLTSKGIELSSTLNNASKQLLSTDKVTLAIKKSADDAVDGLHDLIKKEDDLTSTSKSSADENKQLVYSLEDLEDILGISAEKIQDQANLMGLTVDQFGLYAVEAQEIADKTDEVNDSIDGLQSALSVAQKAFKEYSESGSLTLDTFQELLSISPDYLSALINEDGQIAINQQSLYNLSEQLKIAKIEELQNAAAADILALANGNVSGMSETAKTAVENMGDSASNAGGKFATAAGKLATFAASIYEVVKANNTLAGGGALPDDNDFKAQSDAIIKSYKDIANDISSISIDFSSGGGSSKGGGGKKGKSAEDLAKEALKAYKEQYDKKLDLLDYALAMEVISEEEYYAELGKLNEEYFGEASGHHEDFLNEYQSNQEKIFKWEKQQQKKLLEDKQDQYDKANDYIKKVLKDQLEDIQEERDEELEYLDERIDKIEEKKDAELESIKVTIDALKKEKEAFEDDIDSQIDSLEELRDKEEEQWDDKIDAYNEQNKVLQDQINLQKLQEELAKAKSTKVRVLQGGKFEYTTDEGAVASAEDAIEDYYNQRKQEEELKALEDARDAALEAYKKQIDDLKNYKESMSEQYDKRLEDLDNYYNSTEEKFDLEIEQMQKHHDEIEAEYEEQIKDMEDYIDNFEDMIDEYEDEQNKLALIQLQGTEAESQNWINRLSNLRSFVDDYKKLQKELAEAEKKEYEKKEEATADSGSSSNSESSSSSNKPSGPASDPDLIGRRATGDSSISKNGVYAVGDNPNTELVIGSKLNHNNGVLSYLSKGTGIVNAKSTNTLAGLLNGLNRPKSVDFNKIDRNSNPSNSLLIDKVYVQANNAMEFMESMSREFKINMTQEAFNPL